MASEIDWPATIEEKRRDSMASEIDWPATIEEIQLNDIWIRHAKSLIAKSGARVLVMATVNDIRDTYGENVPEGICCAVLDRLADEWEPNLDAMRETIISLVEEAKDLIAKRAAGEDV
jgi:hypothetical protein